MAILQRLLDNKRLVLGMIVAPLGLYTGICIKDWKTERKVSEIQRELEHTKQEASSEPNTQTELQNLREARASLHHQEALIDQELESVLAKLKRLEAQDAKDK
ncbi:hypothetical protein EV183_003154 [Coemansia sp. RSA 2336]|nr:hypothetical protein EV183_003154 [Coemansia sp. RSA 2336]